MSRKGINLGEKNNMWRGDKVGYFPLHDWVRRHKSKPTLCERCGKKTPYDIANISGKYKRDVSDFEWLCRSCHMKDDDRILNLCQGREGYPERECSICGVLTQGNKYCKTCSKRVRIEWWKEYNQKPHRATYRKDWERRNRKRPTYRADGAEHVADI